MTLGSSCKV